MSRSYLLVRLLTFRLVNVISLMDFLATSEIFFFFFFLISIDSVSYYSPVLRTGGKSSLKWLVMCWLFELSPSWEIITMLETSVVR